MADKTIADRITDGYAVTTPAAADALAIWDAGASTTKGITLTNLMKMLAVVGTDANGLDVNPGSDIDADLISVGVTGAPKIWWDESDESFSFETEADTAIYVALRTAMDATGSLGGFKFFGEDTGGADQYYGRFLVSVNNATPGSEAASFNLQLTRAGVADRQAMILAGGGDETTSLDIFSEENTDGAAVGRVRFYGHDEGANDTIYAQIDGYIVDNAAASEDGGIWLKCLVDNVMTERAEFSKDGISFFGVAASAQKAHVANPTGGATIDAEARTAINSILVTLESFGFHASA